MNIGILGTGMVGDTIGTKLVKAGNTVMMGSRTANNDSAKQWAARLGDRARCGTFADAAAFGEIVFNCTGGAHSLEALKLAGAGPLRGKVLIDVANPLNPHQEGAPMTLAFCNTDSLGEQIQRAYPETRVVKALNTMNCEVMVEPSRVPGNHQLFMCGNDAGAKRQVAESLCAWFGWKPENVLDLGDITAARGMEMFLILWLRLWGAVGNPQFNVAVARGK